jgi:hypothetical protein
MPGRLFSVATKFCTVTPSICASPNLLHFILSAPYDFKVFTRGLFYRRRAWVTSVRRWDCLPFYVFEALFFRAVSDKEYEAFSPVCMDRSRKNASEKEKKVFEVGMLLKVWLSVFAAVLDHGWKVGWVRRRTACGGLH